VELENKREAVVITPFHAITTPSSFCSVKKHLSSVRQLTLVNEDPTATIRPSMSNVGVLYYYKDCKE
jgi:hypothetical protein